jgi:hypothetical protein
VVLADKVLSTVKGGQNNGGVVWLPGGINEWDDHLYEVCENLNQNI